jgi:hypothetical protein
MPTRLLAVEWAVKDSNLRRLLPTDLQSVPVGHLGNRPRCIVKPSVARVQGHGQPRTPTTNAAPPLD